MPDLYIGGPLAQLVEHLTLNQGVTGSIPVRLTINARVAELADALDLGSSGVIPVGVQIPSLAPNQMICEPVGWQFVFCLFSIII